MNGMMCINPLWVKEKFCTKDTSNLVVPGQL